MLDIIHSHHSLLPTLQADDKENVPAISSRAPRQMAILTTNRLTQKLHTGIYGQGKASGRILRRKALGDLKVCTNTQHCCVYRQGNGTYYCAHTLWASSWCTHPSLRYTASLWSKSVFVSTCFLCLWVYL